MGAGGDFKVMVNLIIMNYVAKDVQHEPSCTVLVAESLKHWNLDTYQMALQERGLTVSKSKTKYMYNNFSGTKSKITQPQMVWARCEKELKIK